MTKEDYIKAADEAIDLATSKPGAMSKKKENNFDFPFLGLAAP